MEEDKRKKAVYFTITSAILFVGILIGVMITGNTQKAQTVKTQASENEVGTIEIITPRPGATIIAADIKARFETGEDTSKLIALFKIDEDVAEKMNISRLDDTKIVLDGKMNLAKVEAGKHTLKLYVYSNANSSNTLVGSGVFYFSK